MLSERTQNAMQSPPGIGSGFVSLIESLPRIILYYLNDSRYYDKLFLALNIIYEADIGFAYPFQIFTGVFA